MGKGVMSDIEMVLALVGALFAIVTTSFYMLWCCNEIPRQRYREFLSGLTKYGSYSSGSAPD
jgi:hypothetical protein